MKKQYSLDYSIERDTDRVIAVEEILNTLDTSPSQLQLQQMGSYILYGKDQNGYNAVQRGQVTDGNKHYSTFLKKEDKNLSLQAILQSPTTDQRSLKSAHEKRSYTIPKTTINHPKYDKKTGQLIDIGDADIPGMVDLWDSIDKFEKILAANQGKIAPTENTPLLPNSYRIYQLRHQLAQLRKYQYYLKDCFKPTIHFMAVDHPHTQYMDWSSDCFYWISKDEWQRRTSTSLLHSISKKIEDYEVDEERGLVKWVVRRHTFDWQNPLHVKALLNNYAAIYQYLHGKFDTYGSTLIFDFQRYRQMCNFSPVREFLIDMKIKKMSYSDIVNQLEWKFGIKYNQNYLSNIFAKQIPNTFALTAKKNRIIIETPEAQKKTCKTCGATYPRNILFFGINNNRKDGFASNCKECERKRRIRRGIQSAYDQRSKDSAVLEMQNRKA